MKNNNKDKIKHIIAEAMRSWQFNDEIDSVVEDVANMAKSGKHFSKTYKINNKNFIINYPEFEEKLFTEGMFGDTILDLTAPLDTYRLKATLFHELEHQINQKAMIRKDSHGNISPHRLRFTYNSLKEMIYYYDKNTDDLHYEQELSGYENIKTNKKIFDSVANIMYQVWDNDERDAQQADFIEDKTYLDNVLIDLKTVKRYTENLIDTDKGLQKFWLIIGLEILGNRKSEHNKEIVIKIGVDDEQEKVKRHTPRFYYNYFVKKTMYLYNKTKERYIRNVLKSPQKPKWMN